VTRGINLAVTTPITVSNVAAEEIVHRLDRTRYVRPRTGAAAWESDQVFRSANIELVTPGRRHPYFAYGSNLCVRQMALRCPDASDPRRAVLAGHDWLINQRGVATVEPFDGTQVHGVVWQLSDHDLATLDGAEGVPERYRRNRLTVHTKDGPSDAWVYIDHRVNPGPPRPGYLERIIDGAVHHGLPQRWIDFLRRWDPAR
jgi:hypothetical protein